MILLRNFKSLISNFRFIIIPVLILAIITITNIFLKIITTTMAIVNTIIVNPMFLSVFGRYTNC